MKRVRYFIAAISLLISLFLAFFIFPRMQQFSYNKTFIVRARKEIKLNQTITPEDVEYVEVIDQNLPSDIIKDINIVVGKVSPAHLSSKQWIMKNIFLGAPQLDKRITERLKAGEYLMSVGIKERSQGLDFQLFPGDIVSVYSEIIEVEKGVSLQEIEVFNVRQQDQQLVVTLIVNAEQAKALANLDAKNRIHLTLKQRFTPEIQPKRGKDA